MLKIVQSPNKVLSEQAKPIASIDKSVKHLLKDMEETLLHATDPEGVGLAAPQVGKSVQIFIIKQSSRSPILTFINPVIEDFFDAPKTEEKAAAKKEKKKGVQLEGCLSIQDIWGVVKRKHGVTLSYMDENGDKHTRKFEGFMATIIQHEFDHLQGMLFPKRVIEQANQLYKAHKTPKGEMEFEEISL